MKVKITRAEPVYHLELSEAEIQCIFVALGKTSETQRREALGALGFKVPNKEVGFDLYNDLYGVVYDPTLHELLSEEEGYH